MMKQKAKRHDVMTGKPGRSTGFPADCQIIPEDTDEDTDKER
ncbi:hypothetical protein [Mitsuokella sp. UBA4253]|nr:hypothetical protein [Mitsuokella sp. UBA4253]